MQPLPFLLYASYADVPTDAFDLVVDAVKDKVEEATDIDDDLAHELGYEYTYMSRYFKRCVGISYNDYVNEYRTGRVCYFLTCSDKTVLEISDECGFNSLRSLNRNFKERLGMTPTEYRRARADIKDSKGE